MKRIKVFLATDIKVEINKEKGEVSIMNTGDGIDVAERLRKRKMENQFTFHNFFGELLTSTNYNKEEQKVVGGKNGYGNKYLFKGSFKLETVDRE